MTTARDDGIPEERLDEVLEVIKRRREYHWASNETKMLEPEEDQEVVLLNSHTANCFHRRDDCPMIKHSDSEIQKKPYSEIQFRFDRCGHCWKVPKDL